MSYIVCLPVAFKRINFDVNHVITTEADVLNQMPVGHQATEINIVMKLRTKRSVHGENDFNERLHGQRFWTQ